MRIFPEIWHLNMASHLKFAYIALNRAAPNQIAPNWTMPSQTKACIATCDICTLVRYYSVKSGNSLPTFLDNLLAPSSKEEQGMTEVK